jgi:predicted unusual protein kinase regulating ubiquinone biosynthesis (AarF/ABC1/UbiB family)
MMKFGQMASYLEGAMPPAAQRVLAKLQASATAMPWPQAARVIEDDLGKPASALFDEIEPAPFAAASIGQVHRGRVGDTRVAVKIQYPEIEAALRTDLRTVGIAARLGTLMGPVDGGGLVAELRERVLEECDYRAEASHQEEFRKLIAARTDARAPRVLEDRSGRRVITTELSDGKRFDRFVAEASPEQKNAAAKIIHEVCYRLLFRHGFLQADPHPGNYLFEADGTVTFLDFGCTKRFSPEFLRTWKALARAISTNDRAGFTEAFTAVGMVSAPKKFDFDGQWESVRYLYQPFYKKPFTFTHEFVHGMSDALIWKNPNKMRLRMPPDWLFVNRLQFGLFSVLALLGASGDFATTFQEVIAA